MRRFPAIVCHPHDHQSTHLYVHNKTPLFLVAATMRRFLTAMHHLPPPWVTISDDDAYGTIFLGLMSNLMPLSLVDLKVLSMSSIAHFFLQGVWLNDSEEFEDILRLFEVLHYFRKLHTNCLVIYLFIVSLIFGLFWLIVFSLLDLFDDCSFCHVWWLSTIPLFAFVHGGLVLF